MHRSPHPHRRRGLAAAALAVAAGALSAAGPAAADVAFPLASPSFQSVGDEMVAYKGQLYFAADDGVHGNELWRTDGTAAGTAMVADLDPTGNTNPSRLTVAGGRLYFNPAGPGQGSLKGVYAYDGSGTPTKLTADNSECATLTWIMGTVGDRLLTVGYSPSCANPIHGSFQLFAVPPGASQGTPVSGPIGPIPNGPLTSVSTEMDGWVYFQGTNATGSGLGEGLGSELYRTNGTTVQLVKDIAAGSTDGSPSNLTTVGNQVFFTAYTSVNNRELWRTDGTAGGTRMVHEHRPGSGSPAFYGFAAHRNALFYAVSDPVTGHELWVSDGVTAHVVKDIVPGTSGSGPTLMTSTASKLFFRTNQALWATDGSAAGTQLLVTPPHDGYGVSHPTAVGGRLYFRAGGRGGSVIWRSDGTVAGTRQVTAGPFDAAPGTGNASPGAIGVLGHKVIFSSRFPGDPARSTWRRLTTIDTSLPDPVVPDGPSSGTPPGTTTPTAKRPVAKRKAAKKAKVSLKRKPRITGKVRVGARLTARVPQFKQRGVKLRYQWLAGGKKIKRATKRTFKITGKQRGKRIAVRVTATKKGYRTRVVAAKPTRKVPYRR